MKNVFLILCLLAGTAVHAQEYDNAVKIGAGYAHDFPGLNGVSVFGEVSRYMSERFKGGVGVKFSNLQGNPRTSEVQEYTKAASIDFNLYFIPLSSEAHEVRVGAGYSFSFYNIRRSYPLITNHGPETVTTWPVRDQKSRTSGVSLIGEYEYFIPGTNFSAGARTSLFKAYDHVAFAGVFAGVRF
jgi:hypothetical protein